MRTQKLLSQKLLQKSYQVTDWVCTTWYSHDGVNLVDVLSLEIMKLTGYVGLEALESESHIVV